MEESITSILNLEKLMFEDIEYHRNYLVGDPSKQYEMNFTRNISTHADGHHFKVSLIADFHTEDKAIEMKIVITGFFNCQCEDEKLKEELINNNSVAILFPYLRSQISLMTTQPDILPVIIPPMNIINLFKDAAEQKEN